VTNDTSPFDQDDNNPDDLSSADRELIRAASEALRRLNTRSREQSSEDSSQTAASGLPALNAAAADPVFRVVASDFADAVTALRLQPSEIRLHRKILEGLAPPQAAEGFHRIRMTLEGDGLRLTNAYKGVTCETVLRVTILGGSLRLPTAFLINYVLLELAFGGRDPLFGGNDDPALTLELRLQQNILLFNSGDTRLAWAIYPVEVSTPIPSVPDEAPAYPGLLAQMLEKAIAHAGTFASLSRTTDTESISIAAGMARGGANMALSCFQSSLLEPFNLSISKSDRHAVRSVLLRLSSFRLTATPQEWIVQDQCLSVRICQSVPFHDIAGVLADFDTPDVSCTVNGSDAYLGVTQCMIPHNRESDLSPIAVHLFADDVSDPPVLVMVSQSADGWARVRGGLSHGRAQIVGPQVSAPAVAEGGEGAALERSPAQGGSDRAAGTCDDTGARSGIRWTHWRPPFDINDAFAKVLAMHMKRALIVSSYDEKVHIRVKRGLTMIEMERDGCVARHILARRT
jgi:hypothetical protein